MRLVERYLIREERFRFIVYGVVNTRWVFHYSDGTTESVMSKVKR